MESIYVISILAGILLLIYLYLKRCYTYWERKGLEYLEPEFYFGNVRKLMQGEVCVGVQFQEIYKELKSRGLKHGGIYRLFTPMYIPIDPEILKSIMLKDFNHFVNRGTFINEKLDPLSGSLFNLEDNKWRNLWAKLTPTFTSGKMKMMFQILVACSDVLKEVLEARSGHQEAVDIKDILACFTTDVIGSCAFGLESNSLKNDNDEFRIFGRKIFEEIISVSVLKQLINTVVPRGVLIKTGLKKSRQEIEKFFMNLVKETVEYREKNHIVRKDFMDLLLQLRNKGAVTDDDSTEVKEIFKNGQGYLTIPELAAQCFAFFLAGFETSSTTMTFALFELAQNKDIQTKLREEMISVLKKHDNKLTYDAIMDMPYLETILEETLRKYPPVPVLSRICNKAYTVPGTNLEIEVGIRVMIPVYGLHSDPDYYPNPGVFDPERFSDENKAKRPAFTYMPFGDGPRNCIGLRFGLMQAKVGLVTILKDFTVALHEKTKMPMTLDTTSKVLGIEGGLWLKISKAN